MSDIRKIFDPQELHVYHFRHGIKLLDPDKNNLPLMQDTSHTLSDLFKLPLSIYFLDYESKLQNCNTENLELLKAESLKNVYGKTAFDIFKHEACTKVMKHDQEVIYFQKKLFFDEQMPIKDDLFIDGVSIKLPWYSAENTIIGIVGFTAFIGKYSLAASLSFMAKLGILNQDNKLPPHISGLQLGAVYLTKRETEILHYLIRGKSSRLIAEAIAISVRTVHSHVENIKNKMGVVNKTELIEKALEFFKFIPK